MYPSSIFYSFVMSRATILGDNSYVIFSLSLPLPLSPVSVVSNEVTEYTFRGDDISPTVGQ